MIVETMRVLKDSDEDAGGDADTDVVAHGCNDDPGHQEIGGCRMNSVVMPANIQTEMPQNVMDPKPKNPKFRISMGRQQNAIPVSCSCSAFCSPEPKQ